MPPSKDLKFRAWQQPPTKALLKIRRLLHAFISRHAGRATTMLGGARALLLEFLSKKAGVELRRKIKQRRGNMDDSRIGGSLAVVHLRLLPPPVATPSSSSSSETGLSYCYYDSSWKTVVPAELQPLPVSGYLEWPDEEDHVEDGNEEDAGYNEVDMLAERFIARCHERFMLEKQESYRRFQEMLARSL